MSTNGTLPLLTMSHISIPLPIIIWANGQLDVFMSSEFHHAEENDGWVKRPTGEYKIAHGDKHDQNQALLRNSSVTRRFPKRG